MKHTIGNKYIFKEDDHVEPFILAQVEANKVALISTCGGNRYSDPVTVEKAYSMTREDWEAVTNGDTRLFTKVDV